MAASKRPERRPSKLLAAARRAAIPLIHTNVVFMAGRHRWRSYSIAR